MVWLVQKSGANLRQQRLQITPKPPLLAVLADFRYPPMN
jgi:hypothetical protein